MKHTAVTAIITGALAIGAGVAIAGLPSITPTERLVISGGVVTTTSSVPSTTPTTDTTFIGDSTTTTTGTTTGTPVATTSPSTPLRSTTTTAQTSATSTSTTSSTTTKSVAASSSAPTAGVLLPRNQLRVATANATDRSFVAGRAAEAVKPFGYVDIRPVDSEPSNTSAVYYAPGLEEEAARLANDLLFEPTQIAPMETMPSLQTDFTFDLVAVIGLDRG